MSRARDIAELHGLARILLDHRLSGLREASGRREQSRMQIAALDLAAGAPDLSPVAAGQVALRYQLWADSRRSELNTLLALQTAEWMEAHAEARRAFGRAEALRGLTRRLAERK